MTRGSLIEGQTALVSLRVSASCFFSHSSAHVLMNHVAVPMRQPLATLGSLFLLLVGSNRNPDDGYFLGEKHHDRQRQTGCTECSNKQGRIKLPTSAGDHASSNHRSSPHRGLGQSQRRSQRLVRRWWWTPLAICEHEAARCVRLWNI
jgi:hypothetical protein